MKNNRKQKVLIVSQYYIPDITAAAYRINDMYEAIKDRFEVDIVTTYPHKSNASVDAAAEQNIYRVNITNSSKNRVFRYLGEYFGFMFQSIFLSKKLQKRYDFVFVTSPPIFVLISGYVLSKLKKSKLIVDIRDIWPDVLLDDGTLTEDHFAFKTLKKFEVFIYKKADRLSCVSKYMQKYIESLSGKKVSVIYNGVSQDKPDHSKEQVRQELKRTRLNILYIGNVGFYQYLDVLVLCFQRYPYLSDLFHVHIIGNGAELAKLRKLTDSSKIDAIRFYGSVNKEETNKMVKAEADILFLNLYYSKTLEKTIPSKLFDYLYFNLPIVYGILGEGKEIIEDLKCGFFFQWDSEESLHNALIDIYKHYNDYFEKAKNNSGYVCSRFNRKEMFLNYWNALQGEFGCSYD